MNKRLDLDAVKIRVLPPKVVMLLSQFAYYIKKHDGIVIKLASKTVLKDVHAAHLKVKDYILDELYEQIVDEINAHAQSKPISLFTRRGATIKKPTRIKDPLISRNSKISPESISIYS